MARRTGVDLSALKEIYSEDGDLFVASHRAYEQRIVTTMLAEIESLAQCFSPKETVREIFCKLASNPTRESTGNRYALLTRVVARGTVNRIFYTDSALEASSMDMDETVIWVVLGERDLFQARFLRLIEGGKALGEIPAQIDSQDAALQLVLSLWDYMDWQSTPTRARIQNMIAGTMSHIT